MTMNCEIKTANRPVCPQVASRMSRFGRFACEEHASVADLYVGDILGDYDRPESQTPEWVGNEESTVQILRVLRTYRDEAIEKAFRLHIGYLKVRKNPGPLKDER
jgi:hypothetical protein